MLEQMAYKMQPAGHEEPPQKRKYEEPGRKFSETFEKWLKEFPQKAEYKDRVAAYNKALRQTKHLDYTIYECSSLLLKYQENERLNHAGLFLSAAYNNHKDRVIVYDFTPEHPLIHLGHQFVQHKVLINKGNAGYSALQSGKGCLMNFADIDDDCGSGCSGLILNYGKIGSNSGALLSGALINFGEADWQLGQFAEGIIINCGKAGKELGSSIGKGIVLALENAESHGDPIYKGMKQQTDMSRIFDEKKCKKIEGLAEYVENIRKEFEVARTDSKAVLNVLDKYGADPASKIKHDIIALMKRSGYTDFDFKILFKTKTNHSF